MNWSKEWKPLVWIIVVFVGGFFLPVDAPRIQGALMESLHLVKWYAREHVLLCLVPAFFIAGTVAAPVMGVDEDGRPLWQTALSFTSMVGILIFANWGKTDDPNGLWLRYSMP